MNFDLIKNHWIELYILQEWTVNNFVSKNTFQKTKIASTPVRSENSAFHFIIFLSPVPPHDAIIISIFFFFPRGKCWRARAHTCEGRCIVRMASLNIELAQHFVCLFLLSWANHQLILNYILALSLWNVNLCLLEENISHDSGCLHHTHRYDNVCFWILFVVKTI